MTARPPAPPPPDLSERTRAMEPLLFTIEQFRPDYGVHPGGTLKEVLAEAGLSQADLARAIGISQKHISRVITGKAGIGPDLALRLERALHVDATFWARYQAAFDVHAARSLLSDTEASRR